MESNQNKKTNYNELTTEQKADFIAEMLNMGLVDYFDTCKKDEDGTYTYVQAQTEETIYSTASELVEWVEKEWTPEFFAGEWEARQQ